MKNIIIIIILTFIASTITAQSSLPELIKQYEKECSKMVPDTIDQTGTINYDLVPVKDSNGKILHYALGDPDTTWSAPNCAEYKEEQYVRFGAFGRGSEIQRYNQLNYVTDFSAGPITLSEKTDKTKVKITRKYVCMVKLREVEPFGQNFWDWVKKQTK